MKTEDTQKKQKPQTVEEIPQLTILRKILEGLKNIVIGTIGGIITIALITTLVLFIGRALIALILWSWEPILR